MNFLERILEGFERDKDRTRLQEVHGAGLRPFSGAEILRLVAAAQMRLRDRDVAPGDRVALLAPNSVRWVAADLAALTSGAVTVPLYARQEPAELAAMLRDCEPKLLLVSDPGLLDRLGGHWQPTCPVVLFDDLFGGESDASVPRSHPVRADYPVTIIYTSGTSGEPKGVILSCANVDFMLERTVRRLTETTGHSDGSDRVFHFLPFCFAASRLALWTQLLCANPLMLSTDLKNLVQEMGTAAPDYLLTVPALLERIRFGVGEKLRAKGGFALSLYERGLAGGGPARLAAKLLVFRKIRKAIGANLRFIICGSAALAPETQNWFGLLGIPVLQVYGLTETTGIVTMDRPAFARPGFVGAPIDGCDVRVADDGELLVRGPNLFSGYWRKPEATAAMIRNGWLHTGDQVSIDDEGRISIVGRLKNLLVPASGHNVAPEPLEEALAAACRGIEQAMVVGHGKPYLSVLITGSASDEEIARALEEVNDGLPHYRKIRKYRRLPEAFTPESGLLTANQKMRRKAIEERYRAEIDDLYRGEATVQ